ncbi:MAG: iron ABC transporter substrate-binding protein [Fervidicoccaceae archaeon]
MGASLAHKSSSNTQATVTASLTEALTSQTASSSMAAEQSAPAPQSIFMNTSTTTVTQATTVKQLVDFAGRTVLVPSNVTRIVAIGPGSLRLVAYLGAMDLVVGVEQFEKQSCVGRDYAMAYCDVIQNLLVIGQGGPRSTPDPEKLIIAKPQLVIMSRLYADSYPPDRLESEIGVPVLVIDYGAPGYLKLDDFKKAIRLLGSALGRERRAEELILYIDNLVADIQGRVRNAEHRPSVYIGAVSYQGAQPFTASQARFAPLVLLNTSSIVDELKPEGGYVKVDFEWLLLRQPEYIFIDENNLNIVLDDFSRNKEQYCSLEAFRNGRVYGVIPFNYYHTNIATALANAYYIGKVLYPEAFGDVDPVSKADEIFSFFMGRQIYQAYIGSGYPGFVSLSDVFRCS